MNSSALTQPILPQEYVSFGEVCRTRLSMPCQYGSRYIDDSDAARSFGDTYLGEGLRFTGRDVTGGVSDYHILRIHRDDVKEFVRRVIEHKVKSGAWTRDAPGVLALSDFLADRANI